MVHKIKYCIFDMDGLLLDTERIYSKVCTEILARYGKEFTWDLKAQMMGRKAGDSARILVDTHKLPITVDEYLIERNRLQDEMLPFCKQLPGVLKLIKHLKKYNIPIAVATSSQTKTYLIKSQNNMDLFSLFDKIICGDNPSVKHGKPQPDIFLEAGKQINAIPEQTLVFEDSIPGVQAGVNAGMKTIWIPDPKLREMSPEDFGAIQVLNSMLDFKPELYGLPPFNN